MLIQKVILTVYLAGMGLSGLYDLYDSFFHQLLQGTSSVAERNITNSEYHV